jgi:multidrug efflux system membrane fusion protein
MHDPKSPAPVTDPGHLLPDHTEDAPRSGHTRLILLFVFLILAGAFIGWRIHTGDLAQKKEAAKTAAAANRAIPVQTAPVRQMTVPVFLTALGTVTAYNTVTINTRVDGQILQVYFKEGQAVRKGQLLLQIDPRPYQAALDQALGTLAKDQANLKNTEAEAQRYTALYQAGVVSKESQQLQVANQGQAAGSIQADKAAIEAARVNLAYTRIVSPIDGVVGLRQVDPGNIVNTGQATGLVVITQIHPIAVIFTLPEDQIARVQQAMRASKKPLVVEAYDRSDAHKIATGSLLTIDNQIDTTTGTAKLKAVFDNADGGLFANQFVNVRLILSERQNATVVPTAAISSGNQGDFVFVVNPGPTPEAKRKNKPLATDATGKVPTDEEENKSGDASKQPQKPKFHADTVPVHVDFTIGTNSVLSDGALQPNQQVVVDGQEKLVDGGNVNPQQGKGNGNGQKAGTASSSAGAVQPTTSTQNDGVNGANASSNNATGGGANTSNGGANTAGGSSPR